MPYAKNVDSTKINQLAPTKYAELINSAIKHGFEVSGICSFFDCDEDVAITKLTDALSMLWNSQLTLKLFSSFSDRATNTGGFCCSNHFSQDQMNAAETFCDVYCGHLVSNFAHPAIVKWGNHYLLRQDYFT